MHVFDQSTVGADEIDSLGHLNVHFYFERVNRASRALFAGLGLSDAALDAAGATMRRVDTYSQFRREQFEGAELLVQGGLLDCDAERVRGYFEIRNPARDEVAAVFITGHAMADRQTRQRRGLPDALRGVNERYGVRVPDYAQPRSLSLEPLRTDVALAALLERIPPASELGMTGRREGEVLAEDCGPDGVLRDDVELMFLLFRRAAQSQAQAQAVDAKAFGPPVLHTDEGHRMGWAVMETRNVEFALPRVGDTVVLLGADVALQPKSRRTRRWAFVRDSGRLLGIQDTVAVPIDLDARRAIPVPRSMRTVIERELMPEYG